MKRKLSKESLLLLQLCSIVLSLNLGLLRPISSLMEHTREAIALPFPPAGCTKSPKEETHWWLASTCGKPLSLKLLYLLFHFTSQLFQQYQHLYLFSLAKTRMQATQSPYALPFYVNGPVSEIPCHQKTHSSSLISMPINA